jgi:hypothetical protein
MGLLDWLSGRVSQEKFALLMIEAMRRAGLEDPIEFDAADFALHVGEDRKVFLGNAYDEYHAAPRKLRGQVIEHFAFGIFVSPEDLTPDSFDEAAPNLRPVVRGRMYPEYMRLQAEIDGDDYIDVPSRVIGEHFVEMLAYDMPNRILYLPASQFADWGVTTDAAFDAAHENIRAIGGAFEGTQGRIYLGAWDDSFAASRIVEPQMISRLQVQGRPVVALPNREFLIVTGSSDHEALLQMARMISKAENEPRFESGIVLSLEDDGWRPFLPPKDSPAYPGLHRHSVATIWRDYDEQKRLLDQLYPKRGLDIHVGTFAAHEDRATHELSTMALWIDDLVMLLPCAEQVAFTTGDVDKPQVLGTAPWERVVEVCGDLMEPTDCYPERWRVGDFPTQAQLDAMELDRSALE